MTLKIDTARPNDAGPLGRILSDWIDETPWMPRLRSRDEDRRFVADLIHSGGVLTAREDDTPKGFLFEKHGHVGALYLEPGARGRGIGHRLLGTVKRDCDTIDLWLFEANAGARRFYEREGFRAVERTPGDNAEGLPDIRMTWTRETQNG